MRRLIAYLLVLKYLGKIVKVIEQKDGKSREIISNISYLPNGAVSSMTYGNGIQTSKTYDIKGALNSLNIGNLKQFSYTRDNIGNITSIIDALDSTKTKTYVYDALYRLTQATGAWGTISYGYDGVGNRTTETSTSGTTNYSYSANKLISSIGAKAFAFSYDNNGNTVSENQKTYIYNQNQRLIKAVENGNTLGEYVYNSSGQRVKKVASNRTTYYIYDQSGNMIGEYDGQGQVNIDYIYFGSVPIARVDEWWEGMPSPKAPEGVNITPGDQQLSVSWDANIGLVDGYKVYWGIESGNYTSSVDVGKTTTYTITGLTNGTTYYVAIKAYADLKETYFYHTDHLGTPILMTDKNGTVVWAGEFLPFGEEYSIIGSIMNNLRFPGQYYDVETGLFQNGRRDYIAEVGRYIEKDPIGFKSGDITLYIYVQNNPQKFIDPSGERISVFTRSLDMKITSGSYVHCVLIVEDKCKGTKQTWDFQHSPKPGNIDNVWSPAKRPDYPARNPQTTVVYGKNDKDTLVAFIANEMKYKEYDAIEFIGAASNCCGWVEEVLKKAGISSWKNPNPYPAN